MRRLVTSLILLGLAVPGSALAQGSPSFSQLTGEQGCVTQEPPLLFGDEPLAGCARARGLIQAHGVAVSPDDKHVYVASAGGPGTGSDAIVSFGRDGDSGALTSIGCVSDSGGDGRTGTDGFCADGDALLGATDLVLSPDGRSLYAVSAISAGVTWFARDPATGKLTSGGCIKDFPRDDHCTGSSGLVGATGVAVSPDGKSVYVTAATARSLLVFARDAATGDLTPVECVSDDGSDGRCTDGTGLFGASSVTVAPDGSQVFVTAAAVGAVTTYKRNPADGTLTPQDCLLDQAPRGGSCRSAPALAGAASSAISPDGKTLFVVSSEDGALALFDRDLVTGKLTAGTCFRQQDPQGDDAVEPAEDDSADDAATDGCRPAKALGGAHQVAVAADGRAVFVAGADYLAAFTRNPSTGALEQFGCAEDEKSYKSCAQANGVSGATGLAVSSDGRSLYVANDSLSSVAVFAASVAIASRAASVDRRGRVSVRLSCPRVRARACDGSLRVGAARARAYHVRAGASRSVRARLPKALRRAVRRRGRVHASVAARDARGDSLAVGSAELQLRSEERVRAAAPRRSNPLLPSRR
jgi:DNA-binding beta-propeller fold protein YncE